MSETLSIKERLVNVSERVTKAAEKSGREAQDITVVAITKGVPMVVVDEAILAGQLHFGENYVQEALQKFSDSKGKCQLHLTGHLQRNKVKDAVGFFDLIQSVDRLSVAQAIAHVAQELQQVQAVLLQVNVSGETSKFGVSTENALTLARQIEQLEGIRVDGVMSIGAFVPVDAALAERRADLRRTCALRDRLNQGLGRELKILSMGMSHDYELAIEEGATMVRIGEAIFGPRPRK